MGLADWICTILVALWNLFVLAIGVCHAVEWFRRERELFAERRELLRTRAPELDLTREPERPKRAYGTDEDEYRIERQRRGEPDD